MTLSNPDLLRRRQVLFAGAGAASIAFSSATILAAETLPLAVSLPQSLAAALQLREPLVVMVSLDNCPFCKATRDSYLVPMRAQNNLQVVQVDMHSRKQAVDFSGRQLSHDDLIRGWGIKLAPTLLFFGKEGREVAERLKGASIPDFYGAYLDARLEQARKSVTHSG
jgi:thioredoxin-related protein